MHARTQTRMLDIHAPLGLHVLGHVSSLALHTHARACTAAVNHERGNVSKVW